MCSAESNKMPDEACVGMARPNNIILGPKWPYRGMLGLNPSKVANEACADQEKKGHPNVAPKLYQG